MREFRPFLLFGKASFAQFRPFSVRSFTGMDRNVPNYRNGLPEWTIFCTIEYFLCILLGQRLRFASEVD